MKPSGSRGFGLNSHLSFIHFKETRCFCLFFFFFEINGNFDIALIEAEISLAMHKAYVKICQWLGISLSLGGRAGHQPLLHHLPEGAVWSACTGHVAEPAVSQLGAVKGSWYMELIPCPHSYCPTIPEGPATNPTFSF